MNESNEKQMCGLLFYCDALFRTYVSLKKIEISGRPKFNLYIPKAGPGEPGCRDLRRFQLFQIVDGVAHYLERIENDPDLVQDINDMAR